MDQIDLPSDIKNLIDEYIDIPSADKLIEDITKPSNNEMKTLRQFIKNLKEDYIRLYNIDFINKNLSFRCPELSDKQYQYLIKRGYLISRHSFTAKGECQLEIRVPDITLHFPGKYNSSHYYYKK